MCKKAEDLPQRDELSGLRHCSKDAVLAFSLWESFVSQGEARIRSAATKSRSSAVSFCTRRRSCMISSRRSARSVSATSRLTTFAGALVSQPTGRGPGDTEVGGDRRIPGTLYKLSEPVVVTLLVSSRRCHPSNHQSHRPEQQDFRVSPWARTAWVAKTRTEKSRMSMRAAPLILRGWRSRRKPFFCRPFEFLYTAGSSWFPRA